MIYSVEHDTLERRSWQVSCRSNPHEEHSDNDSDEHLWHEAKSLEDLGELTARWVEGRIGYHPCCKAAAGDIRIAKELAFLNRNGLITMNSQPAEALSDDGRSRRACVEGYASEKVANSIATMSLFTELLVMTYPPDWVGGFEIAIALEDFRPSTWSGASWGYEEQECFLEEVAQPAIDILALAWKVVVIDLRWGRERYLWDHLCEVLTTPPAMPFSVTPGHPGEIKL